MIASNKKHILLGSYHCKLMITGMCVNSQLSPSLHIYPFSIEVSVALSNYVDLSMPNIAKRRKQLNSWLMMSSPGKYGAFSQEVS